MFDNSPKIKIEGQRINFNFYNDINIRAPNYLPQNVCPKFDYI